MTLVHFVTLFYAIIPQTHEDCADDKKIIVNVDPGKNVFFAKNGNILQVSKDDSKQMCWWTFREFIEWMGHCFDSSQY